MNICGFQKEFNRKGRKERKVGLSSWLQSALFARK